jgi:hypothetical protein
LGRPLPYGQPGVPSFPDDLVLPAREALAEAQRLLDIGHPFQAHEVLEAVWKAAPVRERELWRGLTQIVVGVTHLARGNVTGAVALLRRGAGNVAPYASQPPHGIDVAGLAGWAEALAADLEQPGRHSSQPPSVIMVPLFVGPEPEPLPEP